MRRTSKKHYIVLFHGLLFLFFSIRLRTFIIMSSNDARISQQIIYSGYIRDDNDAKLCTIKQYRAER